MHQGHTAATHSEEARAHKPSDELEAAGAAYGPDRRCGERGGVRGRATTALHGGDEATASSIWLISGPNHAPAMAVSTEGKQDAGLNTC